MPRSHSVSDGLVDDGDGARHQHVTGVIRTDVAQRVDGLTWSPEDHK